MSNAYDEFEVRVPVRSQLPPHAKCVIIRDRPESYFGPRGMDRVVLISLNAAGRLHLVPEEVEALADALARWKARRAELRAAAGAEGER